MAGSAVVGSRWKVKNARGQFVTTYNERIAEEIVLAVADTYFGIETLMRKNPHWPHFTTIFEWRRKYPDFDRAYIEAEKARADRCMSDIVEIADDKTYDFYIDEEGRRVPNPTAAQHKKVRIDARLAAAKKLSPQRWGDKIDVNAQLGFRTLDESLPYLK